MVLVPAGAWLLWQRDRTAWRRLWSPRGFLLALVIAGTWPVLVIAREPWALDLWLEHTFGRAAGTLGFGQPWWYYLSTVPYQLLPWTLATLKGAVPSLRRGWQQRDSADRFLWLWGLLPIFVLSLSHGKHHHYLIHCLPAFTAVTTMGILAMGKEIQQRRRDSRFVAWLLVLLIAPALLAAGFFVGQRLPAMRTDIALLGIIGALASGRRRRLLVAG